MQNVTNLNIMDERSNQTTEFETLKREVEAKEKDLTLAAVYGKQLLEKNAELQAELDRVVKEAGFKYEVLLQENYACSLQLEARENEIRYLQSELESQEKERKQNFDKIAKHYESQIISLNLKISTLSSQLEVTENELSENRNYITILENELEEAKISNDSFHHETSCIVLPDDLQVKLDAVTDQKQKLEEEIGLLKKALRSSHAENSKLKASMRSLEKEIEEKEMRLTSLCNAIEKSKEENASLQMEIENCRISESDSAKKGNSLFAEVEDNRLILEKLVASLKGNNSSLKEKYEEKSLLVNKLKKEISCLMAVEGMGECDEDYEKNLEDALSHTKTQLTHFTERCRELEIQLSDRCNKDIPERDEAFNLQDENLFKYLYEKALRRAELLEEELKPMRFKSISQCDAILHLQQQLRESEREKRMALNDVSRLRLKMEQLFLDSELETEKQETRELETEKQETTELGTRDERLKEMDGNMKTVNFTENGISKKILNASRASLQNTKRVQITETASIVEKRNEIQSTEDESERKPRCEAVKDDDNFSECKMQ